MKASELKWDAASLGAVQASEFENQLLVLLHSHRMSGADGTTRKADPMIACAKDAAPAPGAGAKP